MDKYNYKETKLQLEFFAFLVDLWEPFDRVFTILGLFFAIVSNNSDNCDAFLYEELFSIIKPTAFLYEELFSFIKPTNEISSEDIESICSKCLYRLRSKIQMALLIGITTSFTPFFTSLYSSPSNNQIDGLMLAS